MESVGHKIQKFWTETICLDGATLHYTEPEERLWAVFYNGLPIKWRATWCCTTCARFVDRYGALVKIVDGVRSSVFWQEPIGIPEMIEPFRRLREQVDAATLTGVFQPSEYQLHLGTPCSTAYKYNSEETYYHMSFTLPRRLAVERRHTAPYYDMLTRILKDNTQEHVDRAYVMLRDGKLPRSEIHFGPIAWLRDLMLDIKSGDRETKLWAAVANTYQGSINTLRSGAAAELLQAIRDGETDAGVQRRWNKIIDPSSYMRPQAAPTAGAIATAERTFAMLGITENDLRREYLRELPERAVFWHSKKCGIFGCLKPKKTLCESGMASPQSATAVSWPAFLKRLQGATRVEVLLGRRESLFFFITGFPGTRPLMQWHQRRESYRVDAEDCKEERVIQEENLASWYTKRNQSDTTECGLQVGWNNVTAIAKFPHMWDDADKFSHIGVRYLFQLAAHDNGSVGTSLFPEYMRSEFHGVRSVIESYSNQAKVEGGDKPYVSGISISKGTLDHGYIFRITADGLTSTFKITSME